MVIRLLLPALLTVIISGTNLAQTMPDSNLVKIETIDGSEFIGYIQKEDSINIEIKTNSLGLIKLDRRIIHRIEPLPNYLTKNGQYWLPNPQSSRHFWSPNAYGLKEGQGYYQNIWVLWNSVNYGVSDKLSIGGGVIPLFLFSGSSTPVFLSSKLSIPVTPDKLNIGAGVFLGTVIGESSPVFGLLYGNTTFGSRDRNLTVGLGGFFAGGDWVTSPLLNVSAMIRISNRGYFLTENHFILNEDGAVGVLSAGGRWIISRISLDYGLFIPTLDANAGFFALPWLGLTVPFGKRE